MAVSLKIEIQACHLIQQPTGKERDREKQKKNVTSFWSLGKSLPYEAGREKKIIKKKM